MLIASMRPRYCFYEDATHHADPSGANIVGSELILESEKLFYFMAIFLILDCIYLAA